MYVSVIYVIRCLYSTVSLTLVREQRFISIIIIHTLVLFFIFIVLNFFFEPVNGTAPCGIMMWYLMSKAVGLTYEGQNPCGVNKVLLNQTEFSRMLPCVNKMLLNQIKSSRMLPCVNKVQLNQIEFSRMLPCVNKMLLNQIEFSRMLPCVNKVLLNQIQFSRMLPCGVNKVLS